MTRALKTYGKNKKGSQKAGSSTKPPKDNKTVVNNYFFNFIVVNTNSAQGTSNSGDEFDQLLKGPVYHRPNQSSFSSFSNSKFYKRQESFPSYNSDVTPLSSSSSVHLFKDISKDHTELYSPLEPFPKVGRNKKKRYKGVIKQIGGPKKVLKLKCKLPKRISPTAASSTPNDTDLVTLKKRWVDTGVSPITHQPSCISRFTPKSSLQITSPKHMFAVEEYYRRANENTCDMSALVAGLNKLGLSPKPQNVFQNIGHRRSKIKSIGKCSNLNAPLTPLNSSSLTVEESNQAVFANNTEKKYSVLKIGEENVEPDISKLRDEDKENRYSNILNKQAPECIVESNAGISEFYNQGTLLKCSFKKSQSEVWQKPVTSRCPELTMSHQKSTMVEEQCFFTEASFSNEPIRQISLIPGKKWRKSFIKQKRSETRRATISSSVLVKLLKNAGLNTTSHMPSQVSNNTSGSICEPSESFFQNVATRTKPNQAKQTSFFHSIPEEDSFQTINESLVCNLQEPKAVVSPAVKLRIKPRTLNLITEEICEDSREETHRSSSIILEVNKTPVQMREIEQVKESPQVPNTLFDQEVMPQTTTPNLVHDSTLETPPCLKQNTQWLTTITKRRRRKPFKTPTEGELNFQNNSKAECSKLDDEQDLMKTAPDFEENISRATSRKSTVDLFEEDDVEVCIGEDVESTYASCSPHDRDVSAFLNDDTDEDEGQDSDSYAGSEDEQESRMPVMLEDYCKQMLFTEAFSDEDLDTCLKIGEGVYGEVFMFNKENKKTVVKIIPIEGELKVNGEPQKKFDEVLSELVITEKLSNLRSNPNSSTDGFCKLVNKVVIKGKYPEKLMELWHKFDKKEGSENTCPDVFQEDQLYLAIELEHAGTPVETFKFSSAQQSYSVLLQAIFSLAVAEDALEFEHRDMHYGNILVKLTDAKHISYTLNDTTCTLPSYGVKATIIDFTLSRITLKGEVVYYDLATDPDLFTSVGKDYQFEVYRIMKRDLNNNWKEHAPITNVRWLFYLLDKFLNEINKRIKNKKVKKHTDYIKKLKNLKSLLEDPVLPSSFEVAQYLMFSYLETSSIFV